MNNKDIPNPRPKPKSRNNGGWISVKDRLPKTGEMYIIYDPTDEETIKDVTPVACAFYYDEIGFGMPDLEDVDGVVLFPGVTHWQELPDPPK